MEATIPEGAAPPRSVGASPRRLAVESLVALAAYAVVAAVVTWPVARSLDSTVLGVPDSDSAGGIWWLDAIEEHGYRLLGSTEFTQLAVPFGVEQPNALNLQWLLPYFPAYLLTKAIGAVAAYNLTALSGLALSGAAMYLLARVLGASPLVSAWAGLAFLLFPWHVERVVAGHASLAHLECFPLLVLALLLVQRRRARGQLALLAGAVALCWLTSGYYGLMALVIVPVAGTAAALASRPRRPALATAGIATALAAGVTAVVYAASLAGAGGDPSVGQTRSVEDVTTYGLRPLELLVPAPASPLLRRVEPAFWEPRKHGSNIQEISNYLGWITLALAAAWLVVVAAGWASRRERAVTAGAAGVAAVALVLALPGSITVLGARFDAMPSRLVFEAVPVFRVPTRWTVVLFLAVLVLATLGLQALTAGLSARPGPWGRVASVGVVAALLAGSWMELVITHPGVHYEADALPAEYELLRRVPDGALAEYPLVPSENSTSSEYLLRQRLHGRPLVNGASPGTEAEDWRRALVDPTRAGVAGELAARGATAVITRPNTYTRALEVEAAERAPVLGGGFRRIGTTATGASVWEVVASPAAAWAFLTGPEFGEPTLDPSGRIVQELNGPKGSITVVADRRFSGTMTLALRSLGARERRVTVGPRVAVVGDAGDTVTVPLDLAPGRTTITVRVDGAAPGEVALAASAPTVHGRVATG